MIKNFWKAFNRNNSGFTFTEIATTMIILLVLVLSVLPNFAHRSAAARKNEARVTLLSLAQAENEYYAKRGSYYPLASYVSSDATLAVDTDVNKYYKQFKVVTNITAGVASFTAQISSSSLGNGLELIQERGGSPSVQDM